MHPLTPENQFHCTGLYVLTITVMWLTGNVLPAVLKEYLQSTVHEASLAEILQTEKTQNWR